MAGREAEEPATPVFARTDVLTRFSIVAATLAAGVGLALWMMLGHAPPVRPAVALRPPTPPAAAAVATLPLRPRVEPAPPVPPVEAEAKPRVEAARPPRPRPAPPRVIVVVGPAPAKGPGCEASASRAETLICSHPALATAERDDQRAARRAAAAGRRTDPAEWLAVREAAARRGPEALAEAYRRHTSALNRLAEPPH